MLWIFDLDNTLHHASPGVFPHINRMMTDYIIRHLHADEDTANRLRQHYWSRYGATLTGLVRHHGVDPRHFLRHTHPLEDLLPPGGNRSAGRLDTGPPARTQGPAVQRTRALLRRRPHPARHRPAFQRPVRTATSALPCRPRTAFAPSCPACGPGLARAG